VSGYSIRRLNDAAEGAAIVFRVSRSSLARNRFGSVRVTTSEPFGSTTRPGLDYGAVDRIVSFQPGQTFVDVSVQTFNDTEVEANELVNASLSLTRFDGLDSLSIRSAAATIFDRTPVPVIPLPPVPTSVTGTSAGTFTSTTPGITASVVPSIAPPSPPNTIGSPGARGVSYSISKLSDANEGDPASIRITRSDASSVGSVRLFTQSGTALSAADFIAKDEVLNFAAGQFFVDTSVSTQRDFLDEGVETFTANLASIAPFDSVSASSVTININNQQPAAAYAIAKLGDVSEGGSVVLRITRTENLATAGQVRFVTQPGTAISPADFAAQDAVISFAPGQAFADVTVPTVADTIEEPSEDFTATIAAINSVDRLLTPSVAVSIANVPFASSYAVAKLADAIEGQDLNFRITRSGNISNQGSIRVFTQSETAQSPADYQSLDQTLIFQPGQVSLDVAVKTTKDFLREATELLNLNLQLVNPIDSLSVASASAGLIDYEPTSTFSISKVNDANEGSDVVFRILRTGDVEASDSVRFEVQSASAILGVDFVAKSETLAFAPGQTSIDVTVATLKDVLLEGSELFNAVLGVDSPADVIGVGSASATIFNVLPGSTYSLQKLRDADEGEQLLFRVTRAGALDRPGSVRFSTQADSALADVDFKSLNDILRFAPGVSSIDVKVDTLSDFVAENRETLFGTLTKLNDNDELGVSTISAAISNVVRGSTYSLSKPKDVVEGEEAIVTIERSGNTAVAGSVRVQFTSRTARLGTDFDLPNNGLVNFEPGEVTKELRIVTREDRLNEPDESFAVGLAVVGSVDKLVVDSVEATIKNKLVGSNFELLNLADASEGGQIKFRINRNGDTESSASVRFLTRPGTARTGADFVALDRVVEFAPGQLSVDIDVDALEDAINEPSELLSGNLVALDSADTILAAIAEATIANVAPFSRYEISSQGDASEGSNAQFLIKRTGNILASSSVQFSTMPGTAKSGIDYTPVTKVISFKPSEASRVVSVATRADRLRESLEQFTGVISAVGDNDVIINSEAAMNIKNVDLGFSYSIVRVSDAPEGSDVRFRIERNGNKNLTSRVRFFTRPGSATERLDFQPFNGSIDFIRGQTARTISVPTLRDSLRERDESFSGNLSVLNPSDSLLTSSMSATIFNLS